MDNRVVFISRTRPRRSSVRIRRILIAAGVFLFISILFGGAIAALRYEEWQIKNIEVAGEKIIDEGEIKNALSPLSVGSFFFVIPKGSFFMARSDAVSALLLRAFPRLRSVAVKKIFPATLAVTVEERSLFAVLCEPSRGEETKEDISRRCVFIDRDGVGYEEAPQSAGSLILKVERVFPSNAALGDEFIERALMGKMIFLKNAFEERFGIEIIAFAFIPNLESEIRMTSSEGLGLIVKRDDDFEHVSAVLKKLLKDEIGEKRAKLEYIDLRFGNKVFYKWR